MKRILITGVSGFIGSHLLDSLIADGSTEIVGLDLWRSEEIERHVDDPRFTFIKGDVLDEGTRTRALEGVSTVVHLASILGTSETLELIDPSDVARTNILGTLAMLEHLRRNDFERFVYPSVPDVPWLNPYQITKRACERFCRMYAKEYDCFTVVLQLNNVYGPRERWMGADLGAVFNYEKVIPTFITNALTGAPLVVYGDGEQSASYVYVDDVVAAFRAALAAGPQVKGEVIEIGRPESHTVNQIADAVVELTGTSAPVTRTKMRPGEVKISIRPDVSKSERLLGVTAKTGLTTGLNATLAYYKEQVLRADESRQT